MTFRNDPAVGAIPNVGDGSVDVARRTQAGEAVIYNGDSAALVAFLGDDALTVVNDTVYRRTVDGTLVPLTAIAPGSIIVKPMAGDWFPIDELSFTTEYAIHVHVPVKLHNATTSGDVTYAPVKKYAPKKAAPRKKAPAKK